MEKKHTIPKISDLQRRLGLSENGLRLYEKMGIINPIRQENGYRIVDITDAMLITEAMRLTRYGFTIKQVAKLQQDRDISRQYQDFEARLLELQEEMVSLMCRQQNLLEQMHMFYELLYDQRKCSIVTDLTWYFLPIHNQEVMELPGSKDCAEWMCNIPHTRLGTLLPCPDSQKSSKSTVFGVILTSEDHTNKRLPLKHAVSIGGINCKMVRGYISYYTDEIPTYVHCRHILDYTEENGYQPNGDILCRGIGIEHKNGRNVRYDEVMLPIKESPSAKF